MSSAIIQRILHDKYFYIHQLQDEQKVEMYTLVLKEIKEGLERRKPREAPQDSLEDYEDALHEICNVFINLEKKFVGKKYKMKQQVNPQIKRALSCISRAMTIIIENEEKTLEYFDCLVDFQQAVSDAHYYLYNG